jgi:ribokinase
MTRRPALADVARAAGVSLGTASNALNAPDRVRPATRERVYDAMRRLGYGPKGFVFPAARPAAPPAPAPDLPLLATLGYISVDYVARIAVMPHRNDRSTAERISKHLGGPAANVAVAAAAIGPPFALEVELATAIGEDPDSLWALERLATGGVRARAVRNPFRDRLSRCLVLLEADGSRTKVNEPLTISGQDLLPQLPTEPARRPSHLHADGYQVDTLLPSVDRLRDLGWTVSAHDSGFPVAHTTPEGFRTLATRLDSVFVNRRTASRVLGRTLASEHLVAAMADHLRAVAGRGEVVLTLGPDGAAIFPPDAPRPVRVPAPSVAVVDGTGAGDCFVGAYLCQRLHGVPRETAARRACAAASLSMTAEGAQGRPVRAAEIAPGAAPDAVAAR